MPKTFKVVSQVIRLRRHGGVYVGRNNVEYQIKDAAQFAQLVKLEQTGDVQIMCTPKERAELAESTPEPTEPKVEAKAAPEAPKEPTAEPQAPAEASQVPEASGDEVDEGNADEDDSNGDI